MTDIQEFLIQSNLPVLVLTITIVCIVVLGYLEYRNIMDRFDMLENRFESLTKKVKKDIESWLYNILKNIYNLKEIDIFCKTYIEDETEKISEAVN